MPRPLLSPEEIATAAARMPGFRRVGDRLVARFGFPDFAAAAAFGARLAALATAHDHHPEWTTRYREVDVATTTHDAGGLTALDVTLAAAVTAAVAPLGGWPIPGDTTAGRGALWVPAGHFYSPLPDPDELAADAARRWPPRARELPGIDLRIAAQTELARRLARFYPDRVLAEAPDARHRYGTRNDFFGFGDAFVYQALLRHLAPARVVEVGCGWSTALLLDTDERWLHGRTAITCIEPYPDRLLSLLRPDDLARVRLLRQRVQDVDLAEFDRLAENDVLFVDTSHVAKTGSDVVHLVGEVLPRLRPGVFVHFHDVHANFEYDEGWIREGRAWNEAYLLRAFLQHNSAFAIALHVPTLALHAADALLHLAPKVGENVGGSLWLVRR